MKLETVEKKLHMAYPKAFREIYEAGAMRWVCSKPQAKSQTSYWSRNTTPIGIYWNFPLLNGRTTI